MAELLNVDKAVELILSEIRQLPPETLSFEQGAGRILAEAITSQINVPDFANSSMDGYAVQAFDTQHASRENPVSLRIIEDIPAGKPPQKTVHSGEASRIMTGAPLPEGANAIVPVEDTDGQWHDSTLPEQLHVYKAVKSGDYVRQAGESIRQGQVILEAGREIKSAEIGILAAAGIAQIPVIRRPKVVILSSGSELVAPGERLNPGQIYDANSYMLAALIEENGGEAIRLPAAADHLDEIRALFQHAIDLQPDMIISSAGVSVGAADYTRTVFHELGKVSFWRINLRPGKPLAFGTLSNIPFFGLPGNPVSVAVTFDILVRPALLKMAGRPDTSVYTMAYTDEKILSDGRRSYIRVTLSRKNGQLIAHPTGTQSSGALMSIVMADALLIIPEDTTEVEAGTLLRVKLLKSSVSQG